MSKAKPKSERRWIPVPLRGPGEVASFDVEESDDVGRPVPWRARVRVYADDDTNGDCMGLVLTVSLHGVELGQATIWGIPRLDSPANFDDVLAGELLAEALTRARAALSRLRGPASAVVLAWDDDFREWTLTFGEYVATFKMLGLADAPALARAIRKALPGVGVEVRA